MPFTPPAPDEVIEGSGFVPPKPDELEPQKPIATVDPKAVRSLYEQSAIQGTPDARSYMGGATDPFSMKPMISSADVPSGEDFASTGIPKSLAYPLSSAYKTGADLAGYITSPRGAVETAASMTPYGLAMRLKWYYDMAKGTGEGLGTAEAKYEKFLKDPNSFTDEDLQELNDATIGSIANLAGAAKLGEHEYTAKTGVPLAPINRATAAAKLVAKSLNEHPDYGNLIGAMASIQPAIKAKDGTIYYSGADLYKNGALGKIDLRHDDIEQRQKNAGNDVSEGERGFLNLQDGKFYNRADAAKLAQGLGIETKTEDGLLHSEDIRSAIKATHENLKPILDSVETKPADDGSTDIYVKGKKIDNVKLISKPEFQSIFPNENWDTFRGVRRDTKTGQIYLKQRYSDTDPIFNHEIVHLLRDSGFISDAQWNKLKAGVTENEFGEQAKLMYKTPENLQKVLDASSEMQRQKIEDDIYHEAIAVQFENIARGKAAAKPAKATFANAVIGAKKIWDSAVGAVKPLSAKTPAEVAAEIQRGKLRGVDKNNNLIYDAANGQTAPKNTARYAGAGIPPSPEGVDAGASSEVQREKSIRSRPEAEPNPEVASGADAYNKSIGLPPMENHYVPIDEAKAREIADAYHKLPKVDNSPQTIAAYKQLGKEIQAQWDWARNNMGINFERWTDEGQPYANSREMVKDVRDHHHLYFFTGGEEHPLLSVPDADGLTLNDKLRAVHDLFGHAAEDFQFGARGEENAWLKHSQMFTPEAQKALTTENRGQNSWVNYGEHNYENGARKNIPPQERPFAEQKVGLLPEHMIDWRSRLNESQARFSKTQDARDFSDLQWWKRPVAEVEGAGSGAERTGASEARELVPGEKGGYVPLRHWSRQRRDFIDPKFQGTGIEGAEKTRRLANPDLYPNRTYWGLSDYKREQGLGTIPHKIEISGDGLYDWDNDPLDYYSKAEEVAQKKGLKTPQAILSAMEGLVKKDGFAGYYSRTHDVAAMFHKMPAKGRVDMGKESPYGRWSKTLEQFPRTATDILDPEVVVNRPRPKQVPEFELTGADEAAGSSNFSHVYSVADYLSRRSAGLGGGILKELSDENAEQVAKTVAHEAEYAIKRNTKAIGWFGREMKAAMKQIFNRHPELEKDKGRQSLFKAILAVTSNGQNVFSNFEQADRLYSRWKEEGSVPDSENWGGKSKQSINEGLAMLNRLVSKIGIDNLPKFLAQEFTVSELKKAGFDISDEKVNHVGHGSLIFGAKVGGGFYQNLIGNFNPITMDMWLMRTIGRMRGTLTQPAESALKTQVERVLKALPANEANREVLVQDGNRILKALNEGTFDVYKEKDAPSPLFQYANGRFNEFKKTFKDRSEINYATKSMAEEMFGINEAPSSASEREFIRNVWQKAQKKLQAKNINISNADLQAVLWYLEKDIYGRLGATDKRSAPASYSDAAAALNRKQLGLFDEEQGRAADMGGAKPAPAPVSSLGEAGKPLSGKQSLALIASSAKPRERFSASSRSTVEKTDQSTVVDASNGVVIGRARFSIKGYHGSPHDIDVFDISKIGSGEGAQVYGWGLYFAENPKVAESYAESLGEISEFRNKSTGEVVANTDRNFRQLVKLRAEMHQNGVSKDFDEIYHTVKTGNQYRVELNAKDEELLHWDLPFRDQPQKVKDAFSEGFPPLDARGSDLYSRRMPFSEVVKLGRQPSPEEVSKWLLGKGIKGIKYLDQFSRSVPDENVLRENIAKSKSELEAVLSGNLPEKVKETKAVILRHEISAMEGSLKKAQEAPKPTHNYVMFSDEHIKITDKNGEPIPHEQAAKQPRFSKAKEGDWQGDLFNRPKFGVRHDSLVEQAQDRWLKEIERGTGAGWVELVKDARERIAAGEDPYAAWKRFTETGSVNDKDLALLRAHAENLFRDLVYTADKFGENSSQFKEAQNRYQQVQETFIKPQATVWSRVGQALQGETDVFNGSFFGLKEYYKKVNGKEPTPQVEKKLKVIANKGKQANKQEADAKNALVNHDFESAVPTEVDKLAKKVWDKLQSQKMSAIERIKNRLASGSRFSRTQGELPMNEPLSAEQLADYAEVGAILQFEGLTKDQWSSRLISEVGDQIAPHINQIWDAAEKRKTQIEAEELKAVKPFTRERVRQKINKGMTPQDRATMEALEAANRVVRANAAALAKAEAELESTTASVVDPQEKAKLEALAAAGKVVRGMAVDAAKEEAKPTKAVTDPQEKAKQAALDAASRVTRRVAAESAKAVQKAIDKVRAAAIKLAEAENKRRIAAANTKQVIGSLDYTRTEFSKWKSGDKITPEQGKALWSYIRRAYIDKGEMNFDEIRHKVSVELGMKPEDVAKILAKSQTTKRLMDDAWRKQQIARRVKNEAMRMVYHIDQTAWERAIKSIPARMFALKVGFHGTVALGTHAPMVAFQPQFWKAYLNDFIKMYRYVGSPAFYEMEMANLMNRDNFATANRAGLVNDPYKVEDFDNPELSRYIGRLSGMGNRGYAILKVLRQDMFDQHWDSLPDSEKTPEMAQEIAKSVNHATGVVKANIGGNWSQAAATFFFAPKLEASRVMWLVGDPMKAAKIGLNWGKATPEQKWFAKQQFKEKMTVAATTASLLALNQAILSMIGSDQQINVTDPMKSDFGKFKAGGFVFSYGNPMITMARLPLRLWSLLDESKARKRGTVYADESIPSEIFKYARTQFSPFMGTMTDLALGRDFMERPLPSAGFGLIKGSDKVPARLAKDGITAPYTWLEYVIKAGAPIPFQEAIREYFDPSSGKGFDQWMKMIAISAAQAGTGGRATQEAGKKTIFDE